MEVRRSGNVHDLPHFRPGDARIFSLVINVQELTGLCAVQKEAAPPDELQRIPLRRIVTRGDRNPAMRVMMSDGQLNRRDRTHTDVENATAAREQAGNYRVFDHFARSARIAAHDNGAAADVSAERLR